MMKRGIFRGLATILSLVIISGCATIGKNISQNTNGFDRHVIETYKKGLSKEEKIESANFSYIDSDNNGEFDIYRANIKINNKGDNKEITLDYLFSNNNISKYVHIMTKYTLKIISGEENNKIESEMIKYYDYKGDDYKGKEVKSLGDLPSFNEFQPDGKFDLRSNVKMEIIPKEDNPEEDNSKEIPKKRA